MVVTKTFRTRHLFFNSISSLSQTITVHNYLELKSNSSQSTFNPVVNACLLHVRNFTNSHNDVRGYPDYSKLRINENQQHKQLAV